MLLVGLVLLLGLVGVLVPGVPGTWLVWAGLMWWALHERSALAWSLLVAATALLLVVQVVKWQLPPRRPRGLPVTPRTGVFAGAGALLGFVVLPVVGAIPGFVGGVYLCERLRLGGHGEAWASTRAVMRAVGTSVLVELFACLLVVGAWVGAVSAD
ncbi:membrane protein [Streptomyces sp. WM6373]|nr:membrane protein [Streptomyces sp. WM6373]KOU70325.1 membrane protein [Streptomyces sp. XY66]KOU72181.1 membrane protein [Streptomyces sp. IGB124]KOU83540.1 membrane protein [Streptomyces sp. XY58]KOV09387.1 membrane protein [Streptomyces sp. XY37]KOV13563.1 membrane protein [Streptomyces sp. XY413]KOV40976.1 membrane protein [Streptomyces sp. H021]KOV51308.1 membrane protein [Streptomyces sp. MMG1064]